MLTGDVTRTALNIVTATFFLGLMLVYSPTITLAVVAIALVNVLVVVQAARTISEGHRKLSIDRGKLSGVALAGLRDIETFKAAGAEDSFFTRWTGLKAKVASSEQEIGQRSAIFSAVPAFLAMVTAASVLILGGFEVMRGDMTIGTLKLTVNITHTYIGDLTLVLRHDGTEISLTGTEFRLLRYMMLNPGKVLSKSRLAEHIYEYDDDRDSNVIEVLINRLRRKLGPDLIRTRRGLGYQIGGVEKDA